MGLRFTSGEMLVLAELRLHAADGCYGAQLTEATGLPTGSLYPILERLRRGGYTTAAFEDGTASELGRPLRRFHTLTAKGMEAAAEAQSRAIALRLAFGGAT